MMMKQCLLLSLFTLLWTTAAAGGENDSERYYENKDNGTNGGNWTTKGSTVNETTDKSNTSNPVLDPETQYRRANELCIKGCKESRGLCFGYAGPCCLPRKYRIGVDLINWCSCSDVCQKPEACPPPGIKYVDQVETKIVDVKKYQCPCKEVLKTAIGLGAGLAAAACLLLFLFLKNWDFCNNSKEVPEGKETVTVYDETTGTWMTVYAEDVVENDNTEKKLSSETEEDKKALESHDNVVMQSL